MTVRYEGSQGIWVELIKDSVSPQGNRFITMQSHYPRYIHAQRLKHRMDSVNTASSRAIPVKRMIEIIKENTVLPIKFGSNQRGMISGDEVDRREAERHWLRGSALALDVAKDLNELNVHKEVVNRVLEPYMYIMEVGSATEWNNKFHLRIAYDAQGEINELVKGMKYCYDHSNPMLLEHGEWHVPYVDSSRNAHGELRYYDESGKSLTVTEAKAISSSCCAQVSYRRLNKTYDKAMDIYGRLMPEDGNLHATPFEHVATPMSKREWRKRKFAAMFINDDIALFKGNVKGWIQHRKEFSNENNTSEYNFSW